MNGDMRHTSGSGPRRRARDRLVVARYREGESLGAIATSLGLVTATIRAILKAAKVALRARSYEAQTARLLIASRARRQPARDAAIRMARDEGATTREIATRFNLSRQRVQQLLAATP